MTAVDSPDCSDAGCLTSLDGRSTHSTEWVSGPLESGHHAVDLTQLARVNDSDQLRVDSLSVSSARTAVGSRQSSAMKLKGNVEPQSRPQERVVPTSHNASTPPTPLQSPTASGSGGLLTGEERKSTVTADKPSASHTFSQSRRTLSNEPLGAEFDVKQIKVLHGAGSNSSSPNSFDFFADMAPTITSSASVPHKSLLGILSPAAATEAAFTELTSQLGLNDQNCLDTSVSLTLNMFIG